MTVESGELRAIIGPNGASITAAGQMQKFGGVEVMQCRLPTA